jgi:hypothetical protein
VTARGTTSLYDAQMNDRQIFVNFIGAEAPVTGRMR